MGGIIPKCTVPVSLGALRYQPEPSLELPPTLVQMTLVGFEQCKQMDPEGIEFFLQ